jgi:tripartite-type tricarboxylate transporter receptor subunit TctC
MFKWVRSLLTVGLMGLAAGAAIAQEYPTKPITLIVPFAPGGSSDLISRLLGQKLTEAFKQQVIVDNRGGGAGFVGMQAAARAAPDGYTLILGHIGTLAVNPAMFAKMPYKVDEFAPVTLVATVPNVLVVSPALPAKTFQEFIKLAKEKPGTLNYGSAGIGSAGHLAMEYLKQKTGIEMSHVPYKGTGPMITDLLSGQTQATFTGAPPLMPHIKADKLRPLAVGSAKRLET